MTAQIDLASTAARIDDLRRRAERDSLVALLDETAPIYAGRSTADAERLRGYVLASFAEGPPVRDVVGCLRNGLPHQPGRADGEVEPGVVVHLEAGADAVTAVAVTSHHDAGGAGERDPVVGNSPAPFAEPAAEFLPTR